MSIFDTVLERVDIVDVIGRYVPLKKNGSNFKACCPFHNEKTPSFVVSQKKQIFKCFGCGIAGNAVGFVKEYEKISAFESAQKIAKQYGIEVNITKFEKQISSKTTLILQVNTLAKQFYQANLKKYGENAQKYLKEREISFVTIKAFELGYSLNSRLALYNYLIKNHINKQILQESGIIKSSENGHYDLFSNRIIFPIVSNVGTTVAFGGRVMDNSLPKYINSPTTDVYQKNKELYGFYFTKYDIGKLDSVIICEGYMDFLRLYEVGYKNVVASLGTSLTKVQISMLGRFTKNFYILYDGDDAGRKAAIRACGMIVIFGGNPKIICLPQNEDPDSFLLSKGKTELDKIINKSLSFVEYTKENLEISKAIQILTEVASDIENGITRELFIKNISDVFNVSEISLLKNTRKKVFQVKQMPTQKLSGNLEEEMFLKILLSDLEKNCIFLRELEEKHFSDEGNKKIFLEIKKATLKGSLEISNLISKSENPKRIANLSMAENILEIDIKRVILDLKLKKIEEKLRKIDKIINQTLRSNANDKKILEYFDTKKKLKQKLFSLGYKESII